MKELLNRLIGFGLGIGIIGLGRFIFKKTPKYIGIPILIISLIAGPFFVWNSLSRTPIAYAAAALRDSTTTTYASRTNTTCTAPTGIQDGDILFIWFISGTNPEAPDPTPPAGFASVPGYTVIDVTQTNFNVEAYQYYKVASGESGNYTVTHTAASSQCMMAAISGVDTSSPFTPAPTENNGTGGTSTALGLTTDRNDSLVMFVGFDWGDTTNNLTAPSGSTPTFTENEDTAISYMASGVLASAGATGDKTMTNNSTTGAPWGASLVAFNAAATFTLEQEGFAFGDDDGNEASHTLSTQDTDLTAALGTKTLRTLINATDDPSSIAYKLKYQKNGSGGYTDVATTSVTETYTGAIEVADVTADGNNTASASWGVNVPNASTGDLIIVNLGWDDSTTVTDVTAPSGPNGETANVIDGPSASASTAVRAKSWYYVATGSWTAGDLTFTPSASEQWTSVVARVPAGEFDSSTPIGAANELANVGTGNPSCPTLTAGSTDGFGRLLCWIVTDVDDPDGTVTDWTTLNSTDRGAIGANLEVRDGALVDSESVASASGWTVPVATNWITFIYVVRPPADVTNEVYISTSANVTAGGENTTARLTAPSGKTTSDFDTGRRWDDENGLDSIDITADDYTELEYILTTQSPAVNSDYFKFRVYNADAALDTYTVTPMWTIGTAGGGGVSPVSDGVVWFITD